MDGKFLSDCEQTKVLEDKFFILTKTGGLDYKVSFADFISTLKQTMLRDYLKSKIGQLHVNINNKYRDQIKFSDGYLEYLMLNGQTINKKDYPDLFAALGITAETYTLPNYGQEGGCTIRHVPQGSGRALNSYEGDELKSHTHVVNLNLQTETFTIPLDHVHNFAFSGQVTNIVARRYGGEDPVGSGVLGVYRMMDHFGFDYGEWSLCSNGITINVNQNTAGSSKITSDPINVRIKPYNGNTVATGGNETRMKNIAVQCYIVARVII